jgi:tetratricopeptide (TPR) repeat protein
MNRAWLTVMVLVAALTFGGGPGGPSAAKAQGETPVNQLLLASFQLAGQGKHAKAAKLLQEVLKKDPGNPLAPNNLAAIGVKEKKYGEAEAYLKKALPRAKGFMVQTSGVCVPGEPCMTFRPAGKTGNQELEPLIKMNLMMIEGLKASSSPGK